MKFLYSFILGQSSLVVLKKTFNFEYKLSGINEEVLLNKDYMSFQLGSSIRDNKIILNKMEVQLESQIIILAELIKHVEIFTSNFKEYPEKVQLVFQLFVNNPVNKIEIEQILWIYNELYKLINNQEKTQLFTQYKDLFVHLRDLKYYFNTNTNFISRLFSFFGFFSLDLKLKKFPQENADLQIRIIKVGEALKKIERKDPLNNSIKQLNKLVQMLDFIKDVIRQRNYKKGHLLYLDYFINLMVISKKQNLDSTDFDYHFSEIITYEDKLETFYYYLQLSIKSISDLMNHYNHLREILRYYKGCKHQISPFLYRTKFYNNKIFRFNVNFEDEEHTLAKLKIILDKNKQTQLLNFNNTNFNNYQEKPISVEKDPFLSFFNGNFDLSEQVKNNLECRENRCYSGIFLGLNTDDLDEILRSSPI